MKLENKKIIITAFIIFCAFSLGFISSFIYLKSASSKSEISGQEFKLPSDYAASGMNWEDAKKSNKPVVVNFYVDWCHYCKKFAPILNKVKDEYSSKFNFVFVNCDDPQNQYLTGEFNITSYPSLYLVDIKKNKREYIDPYSYQSPITLSKKLDDFLNEK